MARRRNDGPNLTDDQRNELIVGPSLAAAMAGDRDLGSLFEADASRRAAWEVHQTELVDASRDGRPGVRPWGWWRYEAGCEEPRDAVEALRIVASDLAPVEITELRARGAEAAARVGTDEEQCTLHSDGTRTGPDQDAAAIGALLGGDRG